MEGGEAHRIIYSVSLDNATFRNSSVIGQKQLTSAGDSFLLKRVNVDRPMIAYLDIKDYGFRSVYIPIVQPTPMPPPSPAPTASPQDEVDTYC
jgi:hypothetical protein